ncbi:MAG: right-handed parallel beta-helix repeat-containing protein [Proteobacteria bacterium]|nr:right-handed parallel beta-helix repeat-containing protein [Pseudomonadota bacterium]MDA0949174.1 right-handed parallel beta-helix repeat-containing protein [Pseudomonadota bacterium]MDA1082958.1 right-handed parallel beta-helix repeat-containing protein [Pseudomonadota bacterium]
MTRFQKQSRFFALLFISFYSFSETIIISPLEDPYTEIQEALILANPGDIIRITEGFYQLEDSLSIDVDGLILEGVGMDKTILSFKNQLSGAQGLSVTSNGITLRDFAVEDAKGDAIKVKGVENISFIRVRTEWTNGPDELNGAYGLYPVESKNVLIDSCVAIGASDAGIYVGQSENIIVRNSRAEFNVAGIEIENSYYADVYNNHAENNTGGILVFDLPDIPQQGGHHVRVFGNKSINNNTDNFAPEGNIVGEVPRGSGIIIQANSHVEIFDNDIGGNDTINIAVVTYGYDTDDKNYYPHPRNIQIHNNRFTKSGLNPDLETGELAKILYELSEGDMPDIFWDGIVPIKQIILGQPDEEKMVLSQNGNATFLTINPIKFMLPFFDPVERDSIDYMGTIKPLPPVVLNENF